MESAERKKSLFRQIWQSAPMSVIVNLLLVFVLYQVCRLVFLYENREAYAQTMTLAHYLQLARGGVHFDASAICYTNALYILLALLPLHYKERKWYRVMTKAVFVVTNAVCLLIDMGDSVFFEFRGRRTTWAIFNEFGGEGNLGSIIGTELLGHLGLVALFAGMVGVLALAYRYPPKKPLAPLWKYYTVQGVSLVVIGFAAFCGMRGNVFFLSATRPISNNFAFTYTPDAHETSIVLNTPFSMIRTAGSRGVKAPEYFTDKAELDAIYNPVHQPIERADSARTQEKKNVVILIVESFAREFIGGLNRDLDGGTYKGYTPYMDEMLDSCMYFDLQVDNDFWSIDVLPAVMSSIPRFETSFVVGTYTNNHVNSLATELKNMGYTSSFFHGADNQSLGLHAFTIQAGFDNYFGMDEFKADPRFGGASQFDGYWGIWDEPFLQFFAAKISEMKEPFLASVFTLSSHHPFKVPEKYRERFKDEGKHLLHKCIRYTDFSIHRFFEEARKQPWFNNTLFVITADHGSSKRTHEYYTGFMGDYVAPIFFYDPSGKLPRGRQKGISQQIDIMPTVLGYLCYDSPYVAFGKDLINTPAEEHWGINSMRVPTYFMGDYVLTFKDGEVLSLFNHRKDPLCKNNLKGQGIPEEAIMTRRVKAYIQAYFDRMNANDLTVK